MNTIPRALFTLKAGVAARLDKPFRDYKPPPFQLVPENLSHRKIVRFMRQLALKLADRSNGFTTWSVYLPYFDYRYTMNNVPIWGWTVLTDNLKHGKPNAIVHLDSITIEYNGINTVAVTLSFNDQKLKLHQSRVQRPDFYDGSQIVVEVEPSLHVLPPLQK